MADDLKAMLMKVLQNKGKKRYFFAYGTGKRNDGNGDGHLVAAAKKPKKPEVQAACACSSFVEGRCWSSTDGTTVYFSSATKLAAPIVVKMALTTKKVAGKQFDFQIPSPEEEARAAGLTDGDEGEQASTAPGEQPSTSPGPQSDPPPTQNEEGKTPSESSTTIPPPPPSPEDLKNRLKELLVRQKALFEKDPTKKAQLLKVSQAATSLVPTGKPGAAEALSNLEAALTEAEAQVGDGPMDLADLMTRLEPDLLKAQKANPDARTSLGILWDFLVQQVEAKDEEKAKSAFQRLETAIGEALAGAPKTDPGAKFTERLKGLVTQVAKSGTKGPALNEMKLAISEAQTFSRKQDFDQANAVLDRLAGLLEAVPVPQPQTDPAAEWKAKFAEWSATIDLAIRFKGTTSDDAQRAADIQKLKAQTVAQAKPGGDVPQALALLVEAYELAKGHVGASFQSRFEAVKKKVPEPSLGPDMAMVAEIRDMFQKAEAYGNQEKFGEGNSALDDFEKLLKYHSDKLTGAAGEGSAKFPERLKTLDSQVAKSGITGPALNKMRLALKEAKSFGDKKDFNKANAALDRVEELLESSTGLHPKGRRTGGTTEGTVVPEEAGKDESEGPTEETEGSEDVGAPQGRTKGTTEPEKTEEETEETDAK